MRLALDFRWGPDGAASTPAYNIGAILITIAALIFAVDGQPFAALWPFGQLLLIRRILIGEARLATMESARRIHVVVDVPERSTVLVTHQCAGKVSPVVPVKAVPN